MVSRLIQSVSRTYDGGVTLDSFYAPWFENGDIYFKDINTGSFLRNGQSIQVNRRW
ncbi:MAG: hypothetical protein IPL67_06220 [Ignavibacteria bacterium]|nr:hypothetical protein [Ignavibacteria bacterium]